MEGAFDDIEFLTRSINRVKVLEVLATGSSSRAALQEKAGLTRPTLNRILTELVSREWVERRGSDYHATAVGAYLVAEFSTFAERFESVLDVAEIFPYLPEEVAALGVERFLDASVTMATVADPLRPVREAVEGIEDWDLLVMLSPTMTKEALEASSRAVQNGQRFDAVFTRDVVETVRANPALRSSMNEFLSSDAVTCCVVDEKAPCILWYNHGEAGLGLSDVSGAPKALVRTSDAAVFGWVQTTIASYRERATPLGSLSPP